MAKVAELVAEMSLNTARLQADVGKATAIMSRGMKQMASDVALLKNSIAGVVSVGAITAIVKSALDMGSALSDASKKFGVAASELSKLQYAAKMSGVEFEGVGNSMKFLSKSMSEAEDPGSDAARAFKALGISLKDIKGQSPDKVFELVADQMAKFSDGANKTALALALFGRAGADVLPMMENGAAGLRDMKDRAVELGVALSEDQIDKLDKYGDAIDTFGMKAKATAGKMLIGLVDAFKKVSAGIDGARQAMINAGVIGNAEANINEDVFAGGTFKWDTGKKKDAPSLAGSKAKSAAKEAKDSPEGWGAFSDAVLQEAFDTQKALSDIQRESFKDQEKLQEFHLERQAEGAEDYRQTESEAWQIFWDSRKAAEDNYYKALNQGNAGAAIDILNQGLAEQIRLTEEAQTAAAAYTDVWIEANRSATDAAIGIGMGLRDSIIANLSDVVAGVQSVSEAFKNIGKSILKMLADTLLRWVINKAIMASLSATYAAAEVELAVATGTAVAAAWAPAAAMVSLATFGSNSAAAMGGIAATVGLAQALAIPAFGEGGIVDRPTIALIGDKYEREYVIPESKMGVVGGGITQLVIDGEVLASWYNRAVRQGRIAMAPA